MSASRHLANKIRAFFSIAHFFFSSKLCLNAFNYKVWTTSINCVYFILCVIGKFWEYIVRNSAWQVDCIKALYMYLMNVFPPCSISLSHFTAMRHCVWFVSKHVYFPIYVLTQEVSIFFSCVYLFMVPISSKFLKNSIGHSFSFIICTLPCFHFQLFLDLTQNSFVCEYMFSFKIFHFFH